MIELPDLLTEQCRDLGMPLPVREFKFHPTRRWRFDWAWPELRIALECDGGAWVQGRHVRGAGFLADMEKRNAAALAGWRVFGCTPKQVQNGEAVRLVGMAIIQEQTRMEAQS